MVTPDEALPDNCPHRERDGGLDQQSRCRHLEWRMGQEINIIRLDKLVDGAVGAVRIAESRRCRVSLQREEGVDHP